MSLWHKPACRRKDDMYRVPTHVSSVHWLGLFDSWHRLSDLSDTTDWLTDYTIGNTTWLSDRSLIKYIQDSGWHFITSKINWIIFIYFILFVYYLNQTTNESINTHNQNTHTHKHTYTIKYVYENNESSLSLSHSAVSDHCASEPSKRVAWLTALLLYCIVYILYSTLGSAAPLWKEKSYNIKYSIRTEKLTFNTLNH